MSASAKDLAAMRKEIYSIFDKHGIRVEGALHKEVSAALKSYHEHRVIEVPAPAPTVVEHRITCEKCQGVEVKKNRYGKFYVKVLQEHKKKTDARQNNSTDQREG